MRHTVTPDSSQLGVTVFGFRSTGYDSALLLRSPTTVLQSLNVFAGRFVLASVLAGLAMATSAQPLSGESDILFRAVPLADAPDDNLEVTGIASALPLTRMAGKSFRVEAPPVDYQSVHGAIDSYRAAIAGLEAQEGHFAPELFQNLVGVAKQYEKLGEFELALTELERAEHVDRINHGLYTQAQITLSEDIIRLLGKLNQTEAVGDRLNNYVYMHEKLYGQDSVQIVSALDKLAEWQFQAFRQSVARYPAENPGMVNYLNGLVVEDGPHGILEKTQKTWLRAIRLLVENKAFSNPMLPLLENKLLATYYAHANLGRMLYGTNSSDSIANHAFAPMDGGATAEIEHMNFTNGVNVFKRKMHYLEAAGQPAAEDYADTLVELGDWYLLFGHRRDALETYQDAYELMQANRVATDGRFNPAVPYSLSGATWPASETSVPDSAKVHGYVDVAFTLTQYGRASKIRLLGASENTGKQVSNRLIREIRSSQFRPLAAEGKAASKQQLAMRYYYHY